MLPKPAAYGIQLKFFDGLGCMQVAEEEVFSIKLSHLLQVHALPAQNGQACQGGLPDICRACALQHHQVTHYLLMDALGVVYVVLLCM